VEHIVEELMRRYHDLIESLISSLTEDQVLCVHRTPLKFEEGEDNKIGLTQELHHHILNPDDPCDLPGKSDQYMLR
jgi:hypothetical protein